MELKVLNANIKEIAEKEGGHENYIKVLEHLIKHTEDVKDINSVNPLDGAPGKILRKILNIKSITFMKDVFQTFTTGDTRLSMTNKLSLLEKSIIKSCSRRETSLAINISQNLNIF